MTAATPDEASFERRVEEAREREAQPLSRRERLTRGALAIAFTASAALFFLTAGSSLHPPWSVYVAFAVAYGVASRVKFEVGAGMLVPTVLVVIPALFVLPAPAVPLVVAAGSVTAATLEALVARRPAVRAAIVATGSCFFVLGPAVVFLLAGEPSADAVGAAIAVAAMIAQVVVDAGTAVVSEWLALELHPRELVRPLVAVATVDLLLMPLGLLAAIAVAAHPWAVLLPSALLGLLVVFAHDRKQRLDDVLAALDRSVAAEQALRESEARFRELAAAIPEVFFLFSIEPRETLYVSPAYQDVWGRPPESALGASAAWRTGIHPDDEARVARELHGGSQRVVESSFRVVRPGGEIRWVVMQLFPIPGPDGQTARVAGVARDLSEQKTLEDQLRQSQKMEAIGQLAGGVAHDFNNLLTAISGYAELALMRVDDDRTQGQLRNITAASARAAGLTKQILAFSRRQVMQPEVVSLNVVATETAELIERLMGPSVVMRLDLEESLAPVLADAGQLGQVVMNLAINARDAMPDGGMLTIRTQNVELGEAEAREVWGAEPGAYAKLSVRDTGTGMSAETKRRVFEPFFTTKEPGKGTGLGLSTCYGIVKQTGGYIDVESELGKGTEFVLYFPVTEHRAGVQDDDVEDDGVRHAGARVLLVEDEPVVRELASEMLENEGFAVEAVAAPGEAIAAWAERDFDVLVTDLAMPQMSGRDLAARLAAPCVVYVSGYSGDAVAGSLAGSHYVQKPFSSAEVGAAVRAALDERLVRG